MPGIKKLTALEILDSRGDPTVQASCYLDDGSVGTASVPSGASKGVAEAVELRDHDPTRYRGRGCRKAVSLLSGELNEAVAGRYFKGLKEFEAVLRELDGTLNKSRLGANTVLAASLAFVRAGAVRDGVPLYQYLAEFLSRRAEHLPRPMINIFSGGRHAGQQISLQDIQVVPLLADSIDESLAITAEIFHCAAELIETKYGARKLTADEGGLAPAFTSAEQMLEDTVSAILAAGFTPGKDAAIALDVAASHFFTSDGYHLEEKPTDSVDLISRIERWVNDYPIVSVEDGLAEDDWTFWPVLCRSLKGRALTLGDDLLCTNPDRIGRAIEEGSADALLLKVNQIGTLSEAAEAYGRALSAGWEVVFSARSGETEDSWLADLAVGWGGRKIKIGSINQSERLAKYNRLLQIESETGLPLAEW